MHVGIEVCIINLCCYAFKFAQGRAFFDINRLVSVCTLIIFLSNVGKKLQAVRRC